MGRLSEIIYGNPDTGRLLWEEIRDGTIIWNRPTNAEVEQRRARRRTLFEESHVPWILNDIGALVGFYDDVQDVVSLGLWGGALAGVRKGQRIAGAKNLDRSEELARLFNRECSGGRAAKRTMQRMMSPWHSLSLGLPLALALKFLPKHPAIMFPLLLWQAASTILGVGISLGPIVGASLETTYGAMAALGFEWGGDRNKAHQMRNARVLKMAYKGFGTWDYVRWDDRLATYVGTAIALRDLQPIPPVEIRAEDVPRAEDIFADPWGTIKNLWKLGTAILPNAAAYIANDLITPMFNDLSKVSGGTGWEGKTELSDRAKAVLKRQHMNRCPDISACVDAIDDVMEYTNWVLKAGLPTESSALADTMYEGLFGGLFTGPYRPYG